MNRDRIFVFSPARQYAVGGLSLCVDRAVLDREGSVVVFARILDLQQLRFEDRVVLSSGHSRRTFVKAVLRIEPNIERDKLELTLLSLSEHLGAELRGDCHPPTVPERSIDELWQLARSLAHAPNLLQQL